MNFLYKTKQQNIISSSAIQHITSQNEFEERSYQTGDKNNIYKIINSPNYPSVSELDSLIAYCENSKSDDLGINLFFFKLSFFTNNFFYAKLYFSVLKRTCQLSSFVCDYFIKEELFDCLISHIFENSQSSKNSVSFLIKILYKTKRRAFLLRTQFFNIFSFLTKNQLSEITNAFFSHTDEIDQNIFEITRIYTCQVIPSEDAHKDYRFLNSILQLSIKGLRNENIDHFINAYINTKIVFMLEIILQLIPFSPNISVYVELVMSCLCSSNEIIANASIRTFSNIWDDLSYEQKYGFSSAISALIENMSFKSCDLVISLIVNVRDWQIFNKFKFFQKIVNLINHSDISQKCLYAIVTFLMDENVDTRLKSKVIHYLCENTEDLIDASHSPDNTTLMLANTLLLSIGAGQLFASE